MHRFITAVITVDDDIKILTALRLDCNKLLGVFDFW